MRPLTDPVGLRFDSFVGQLFIEVGILLHIVPHQSGWQAELVQGVTRHRLVDRLATEVHEGVHPRVS